MSTQAYSDSGCERNLMKGHGTMNELGMRWNCGDDEYWEHEGDRMDGDRVGKR